MEWTQDKIKHYKFCYNLVSKAPKCIQIVIAVIIFIGGICKEIWDFLGFGTPELQDIYANIEGIKDALQNKPSQF